MHSGSVYDSRFFIEYFYSQDTQLRERLKADLRREDQRMVSAVAIHEVYKLIQEREGREVADLRCETIRKDFQVMSVDYSLAVQAARLRAHHRLPLADSLMVATALAYKAALVSDDPHFRGIKGVSLRFP